ncbi:MAG: SMP-30/gluconolactonase/LRE family protein, partial [Muribaculaceae bacterium]|nr:SMP-30/gluconolactonase/LRE family protein [Muribaculaceae bacterium]
LHPAFDSSPIRIVDTERFTFVQAFQKNYIPNTDTYNTPVTAALVLDKRDRASGMRPLGEVFSLNGGSVRTCEYSPENKLFVILYMDGGIDIVTESGDTRHNDTLKETAIPDWQWINSMTLYGSEIWVATSGGYMVVDAKTGRTAFLANLGQEVKWISRCGDRIIAFNGNNMFECDGSRFPANFNDFKGLSISGSPACPKMLMPRADGSFLYLGDKVSSGNYSLNIAAHDGKGWRHRFISDLQVPEAGTIAISHPFEMNFVRNRDGWLLFTDTDMRQIHEDASFDGADLVTAVPVVRKDSPESPRRINVLGSWDGSSGLTYFDRGQFAPGELSEGRFMIDDAAAERPNLPAAAHAPYIAYAPGYGTLAVNYGYSWTFPVFMSNQPPLLSVYSGGEWTLPAPVYCKPRSAEENADLNSIYVANAYRFPLPSPVGVISDPVNPDYAWMGSDFGGLAAMNLRDPKSDPIHLGTIDDPLSGYPGFKVAFPNSPSWKGYAPAMCPSFDSDGNLWTIYHFKDGILTSGESPMLLYCWPRANREKVLASGDVSQMEDMICYKIPSDKQINATTKCMATRHPDNRNLIFMFYTNQPRYLIRLNHGGTLNDASDDKMDRIKAIEDQNGGLWNINVCNYLLEEPSTGLVWVAEDTTVFGFDPNGEVTNGVIKGVVLDVSDLDYQGNPLSFNDCQALAFDDSGRLWITTIGNGIWGISADKKRVEAHYTKENSRLPDDVCYGIAWNPDSRSLMISTREGLAEVWPDAPRSGGDKASEIAVWPREVKVDYTGPVIISGLLSGISVSVCDKDGKEVARLQSDGAGRAFWTLTDSAGKKVKSGFYKLKGIFGEVEIAVMR